MRSLTRWETYTRKEAHDILDPQANFTPQTGTWGLQGIVPIAAAPGDFAFFVTFGTTQGDHDFDEDISEDGVLSWQSQPRQRLQSAQIRQFIEHDDLTNSIHLFLRQEKPGPYTYFGRLGYLDHDPNREQPVYFTWQLMDWPAPSSVLDALGIVPSAPTEPVSPASAVRNTLTKMDPPARTPGPGRGPGGAGKHATLPGQDAKNRVLGRAGEDLALMHERQSLIAAGRADLATQILHVAVVEGDSAGYDIKSFNPDGTDRHIEVKTTGGPASNAFFISPNEVAFSTAHGGSYVLMRIYAFSSFENSANFYECLGPIAGGFDLTPSEYRARLLPSD
jgi:hypothetical protein